MKYQVLILTLIISLAACQAEGQGTSNAKSPSPTQQTNIDGNSEQSEKIDPRPYPLGDDNPWLVAVTSPTPIKDARKLAARTLAAAEDGTSLHGEFGALGDFDRNFIRDYLALVEVVRPDYRRHVLPAIFQRVRGGAGYTIPKRPLVKLLAGQNHQFSISYYDEIAKEIDSEIICFMVDDRIFTSTERSQTKKLSCYIYKDLRLEESLEEIVFQKIMDSEGRVTSTLQSKIAVKDVLPERTGNEIIFYDRVRRTSSQTEGPVPDSMLYPLIYSYESNMGLKKLTGPDVLGLILKSGIIPDRDLPVWLLIVSRAPDLAEAEDLVGRFSSIAGIRFFTATAKDYADLPDEGYYIVRPFIEWETALQYQTALEDRGAQTQLLLTKFNHPTNEQEVTSP